MSAERTAVRRHSPLLRAIRAPLDTLAGLSSWGSDATVHEARNQLKRARAALRLIRTAIGDVPYQNANQRLRGVATSLAAQRDAAVLLETLSGLMKKGDGKTFAAFMRGLRRRLLVEHTRRHPLIDPVVVQHNADAVHEVLGALASVPLRQPPPVSARRGICGTFQRGRKAFAAARRRPLDTHLHEWRKQTRYLANELEVAADQLKLREEKMHRRASALASLLGDDHDLAVLRNTLRTLPLKGSGRQRRQLDRRIDERRSKLQSRAMTLGEKLYEDSPRTLNKTLRRRLHG